MADEPDLTRNPAPRPAEPQDVSAHDLLIADLQAFGFPDMTRTTETLVAARKRYGVDKYDTILFKDNGRDYVLDAEDEAVDLCVYLRCMIDNNTAPREWLLPLYRDAVWALLCLHTYRTTGGCLPIMEKYTWPLVELADVRAANLDPTMDDGHACLAPKTDRIAEDWIMCGGLQYDQNMCICSLGEHPDGYGWCPRHGVRQEPNEIIRDTCERCAQPIAKLGLGWRHTHEGAETRCPRACPSQAFPGETTERKDELLAARAYYDTHDAVGEPLTPADRHQAVRENDAPEVEAWLGGSSDV